MRNITALAAIDYGKTELIAFNATVISIIAEGDGGKKPFKFTVKLEDSGEVATVTSWKFENLDTIKSLVKTNEIYHFEASAGNFGTYGNQIRVGNISPTGLKSEKKIIRTRDMDDVRREITAMVAKYEKTNPLYLMCQKLILENDDYFRWPAATKIHHAYPGGLAVHSLGVAKNAISIWENYKGEHIELPLLVAGALLHDIGKLEEYDVDGKRTVYGNLIPHPVAGENTICKVCAMSNINPDKELDILMLRHIILTHHEKLEFGAPTQPYIPEAWIVAAADRLDAEVESIENGMTNLQRFETTEKLISLDGGKVIKWRN